MFEPWILAYLIVSVTWTGNIKYEPAEMELSSYAVCVATKEDLNKVYGEDGLKKFSGLICRRKTE